MSRIAALVGLALAATSALAQYPYVVDSFHTEIVVKPDATISVSEKIEVTYNEPRRGIFRTIPIVYPYDERGNERAIQLRLGAVVDESGNRHTTKVAREGDNLKIRIGDEDVFLDKGTRRTYIIQYTVYGAFNWFEEGDWQPWAELYWNVTGNEWDTQVSKASFRVTFPGQDTVDKVRGRLFAGPYGDRTSIELLNAGSASGNGQPPAKLDLDRSSMSGETTEPLRPFTGMTFVLGIPAEAVPKPPPYVELMRRLTEYLPLFAPILVFFVMLMVWSRFGRDPKDGPKSVRFEPPSSLPAAEAGTILDESVDQRDLAAGIMSLCVKGYLTVEVIQDEGVFRSREYALHPTEKTDTTGLSVFESKLLDRMHAAGDPITRNDLREYVAPYMMSLKAGIYQDFADRGLYRSNPSSARAGGIFLGIAIAVVVTFVLSKFSLVLDDWVWIVGGGLSLIPAFAFGWQMPMRTAYGTQVRRETLGFYEMMRHREHYMKWVVEKQPDGLKYEEYLPYAVAFDLIEEWNDAFKDIVHEPPQWYHDRFGGPFYAGLFAHDLRAMATNLGSAASTPPRSSGASGGNSGFSFGGGGGGGFSGGGFGGGGGGSW